MSVDMSRRVLSCEINGRRFPGGTLADWNAWVLRIIAERNGR